MPTSRQPLRPAVFLDRDGTIIEDRGHLRDPSEAVFFPDAFAALRSLAERFALFIVTNQPGIAEGAITPADVETVNRAVVGRLAEEGVTIEAVYFCPHRRADGCRCIKPNPHFLLAAGREHDIDLGRSFVVGDHPHDVELAERAGATGIYVLTGHGQKHRAELPPGQLVAEGIAQAARIALSLDAERSPRP